MAPSRTLALVVFASLLLSASSDREEPCDTTSRAIFAQYGINDAGYDKPSVVSPYSVCYGMEATCCDPATEKKVVPRVQSAFLSDLQSVLNKLYGTSHSRIDQHFNRGLFQTLSDAKEILTKEVREILPAMQYSTWNPFDQLFSFLQEFPYTQNFCKLRSTIHGTIKELASIALGSHHEPDKINSTHINNHFISTWSERVHRSMLGYLYYLRNMEQALDALNSVVQKVRKRQFSPGTPCTSAIMRISHCGLCLGYVQTKPCDGNCINTLRGCFSDEAEVQSLLKDFANQLQKFAMLSMTDFHPVSFTEGALMDFVKLSRHLMEANLTMISQSGSKPTNETITKKPSPTLTQAKLSFSSPHEYKHHLQKAFNEELECISKIGQGLLEIPEHMCGVNPKHTEYIRNIECWNGTAWGSYKGALGGHLIQDQLHNPSFTDAEQQVFSHHSTDYQPQINQLIKSMAEIDNYTQLYECLGSNDEDCSVTIQTTCSHVPHIDDPYLTEILLTDSPAVEEQGSADVASGYQSGNSPYPYGSGDNDNEGGTSPTQTSPLEFPDDLTATSYEQIVVIKLIPPYVTDSNSDVQIMINPANVSQTQSESLSSTADVISPSSSTDSVPTTSTSHFTIEVITMTDVESTYTPTDGTTPQPLVFGENNPSGSSSCYLSSTAPLVSVAIVCCAVMQLFAF